MLKSFSRNRNRSITAASNASLSDFEIHIATVLIAGRMACRKEKGTSLIIKCAAKPAMFRLSHQALVGLGRDELACQPWRRAVANRFVNPTSHSRNSTHPTSRRHFHSPNTSFMPYRPAALPAGTCAAGAGGVAVAVGGADGQLDRLAEHAEDDRVLAGIVADADGVVADLAVRALCRAGPRGRGDASVWPITLGDRSRRTSGPCRWARPP